MHTHSTAVIATETARSAGTLTAGEVRDAVSRFLAAREVAALAHAALTGRTARPILDELRSRFHGYAARGVICDSTPRGLAVEIEDRGGLVPWPLLAQIVADGATPDRVAALDIAIAHDDRRAAQDAADLIVLAGPTATQLDLLDHLGEQEEQGEPDPPPAPAPARARRTRKTTSTGSKTSTGSTTSKVGAL